MDEMIARIRAALDDQQRRILVGWDSDGKARVATMWTGHEPGYTTVASDQGDNEWVADGREVDDARHVTVLFDPAAELRRIDAMRKMVDRCDETLRFAAPYFTVESCDEEDAILAEQVVQLLAQMVASNHEDRAEETR